MEKYNLKEMMMKLHKIYRHNKDNPEFINFIEKLAYEDRNNRILNKVDNYTVPWWYSSHLSMREMAKRAGITHERVRQIIMARHLPKPKRPHMPRKPLEPWYNPTKTIEEMAAVANKSVASVRSYVIRLKLPYKYKITIIDKVYAPDRTVDEMYAAGNGEISKASIRAALSNNDLKYVKVHKNNKRNIDINSWYDERLTISEMAEKSGMSYSQIYDLLRYRKLPYNKNSRASNGKINVEEWYNPNLTVKEMAAKSGLSSKTVNNVLYSRGLTFKKSVFVVNNHNEWVYTWYDPSLSIKEMATLTERPYSTIKNILLRLKLPFKRLRK